jgi:hypothetical protein
MKADYTSSQSRKDFSHGVGAAKEVGSEATSSPFGSGSGCLRKCKSLSRPIHLTRSFLTLLVDVGYK